MPTTGRSPSSKARAGGHLRQSMDASRGKVILLVSAARMRESIRPVAGAITLLALMGVRCL
jgi:hypothetical protein